ncbi:response regulator [Bradyrhizobium monzae]|uniref:response regulator n=1 Tax=Bradyrhizobium sp. Oc8 TaxID=2876780 RepID=UPI0032086E10
MKEPVRILVAEDEFAIQGLVGDALSDGGFETEIAGSGEGLSPTSAMVAPEFRALLTDIGTDLNG